MKRRAHIEAAIERKKAKLAKLEERIGYLCSQRVEEEVALADLLKKLREIGESDVTVTEEP